MVGTLRFAHPTLIEWRCYKMQNIFIVGVGGMIGTILRYLMNNWIYRLLDYPVFPFGTLLVNLVGCLVIGVLGGLAETRLAFTPEIKLFIFIGILGGFTTFSSFGYDTFGLLREGQFFYAALNVSIQVFVGLTAVWAGYTFSRLFE